MDEIRVIDFVRKLESKKETEVVGLVEDLYKNYQSIYDQYGHLRDEAERIVKSEKENEEDKEDVCSSSLSSSSDSDSEYFSSEEVNITSSVHNLQNEQSSNWFVQIQTEELEKQIVQKNEALAKVDFLHRELDSVRTQKREMENRKNKEISENMALIGNLKEELVEKIGVEKKMLEEKERVLARSKDLEMEIDTLHYRRREIEEQNIRMRSENQWLNTKISELEMALTSKETEASSQTVALMEQVKNLKHTINGLQTEKTKLGQEMEQYKQEVSHRFSEMEEENKKLRTKIVDQETILKEKEETIIKFNEKYKKAKSCLPDVASSLINTERKMEELAEDLRCGLEDKIRLLSQRILVAEQLHNESRENFRVKNKRHEQEKRHFEQKIEKHEEELMKLSNVNEFGMDRVARRFEEESSIYDQYGHLRDEAERIVKSEKENEEDKEDVCSSSLSSSSDSDSEYFSSEEVNITSSVHNLQNEQSSNWFVQIQTEELEKQIVQKNEALAKVDFLHRELDSVRTQKREMENRKNKEISENMVLIGNLKEELVEKIGVEKKMLEEKERMEEKEEQEFLLREKLWNLEAKISKEGGEKLNLIRTLGQFEKKMTKMENLVKEKDEEVFRLAEEKREVIRQLCVVIDHYRSQSDHLKDAMLGKTVRNRRMI
ncbi:golgin subfamily A member 6-like protein 22 [Cucurbita pepo subsp. pepo]|uniref:golgin subfamily A member 6-like protein 22 n=1 Tax=Cucurbita pepo subsp. pepo TaxID=3664 RepID=UPI000C9D4256|nr:golgin subfamily A member 6-like protein 22 [Cucurbita pepo subsp. pepo]